MVTKWERSQDSICVPSCSTSVIPADALYHKSISQSVSKNVYHSWPPSANTVDSATKTNHRLLNPQIQTYRKPLFWSEIQSTATPSENARDLCLKHFICKKKSCVFSVLEVVKEVLLPCKTAFVNSLTDSHPGLSIDLAAVWLSTVLH